MDAILNLCLKFVLIACAAGAVFVGKKYLNTKDDNIVEELVEHHIQKETGMDVDLSPESQEPRQMIIRNELIQSID